MGRDEVNRLREMLMKGSRWTRSGCSKSRKLSLIIFENFQNKILGRNINFLILSFEI